jgi:hypothetical protein
VPSRTAAVCVRAAATTALGSFAIPRTARRCSPCLKPSPKTLDWVPLASPAAARCRPAAYTRLAPSDQDPTRLIKPPHHLTPPPPLALGSRSNGSIDRVNPGQTSRPDDFAESPLHFLEFTKIPSRLRKILTFNPFSLF